VDDAGELVALDEAPDGLGRGAEVDVRDFLDGEEEMFAVGGGHNSGLLESRLTLPPDRALAVSCLVYNCRSSSARAGPHLGMRGHARDLLGCTAAAEAAGGTRPAHTELPTSSPERGRSTASSKTSVLPKTECKGKHVQLDPAYGAISLWPPRNGGPCLIRGSGRT